MGDKAIGPQIPTVSAVEADENATENEEEVMAEFQRRMAALEAEEKQKEAEESDDSDEDEEFEELSDEDVEMDENKTDALSEVSEESLITFLEDFKAKKVEATPSEVVTMYQQLLSVNPSLSYIWIDYCKYLESLNDHARALEAYEKGLKLHPYETPLVQNALLACEKANTDVSVINKIFEEHEDKLESAEAGKQLYTTFIYIHRRLGASVKQLDALFQQGIKNLEGYFDKYWDDDTIFRQNYAYFLYSRKKAPEEAYQVWRSILKGNGNKEDLWLEFVRLERFFGTVENARKLLYEAFEREEGNREQVDKALVKINNRWHQINERKVKEAGKQQKRGPTPKGKGEVQRPAKRTILGEIEVGKKKRKVEDERTPEKSPNLDKDGFAVPILPLKTKPKKDEKTEGSGQKEPAEGTNGIQEGGDMEAESSRASPEGIPDRTVFLSNINFSWKEFDVRKLFPNAIEIRMPMRNKTQSKGYAYVDFGTKEEALEVLAQDGQHKSNGRPIHISAYQPHGKGEKAPFKFATQREDNKLFVRNVHYEVTEAQLKEFFDKFAPVKSARIVTRPNGLPKGIAYIEYSNPEDAQKALEADGRKLHGRKISVAISDPSVKKEAPKNELQRDVPPKEKPVLGVAEQRKAVLAFKPRSRVLLDKK
ncbi:unnamed protein product [Bursaphelenchus xylophilus]|uniref:(pine wood nematode) hypothetical protein n=1 Tax=Bursaphelenchus xylophilus TaxID=6326 RepID=A0A7I8WXI5_BURXY|nr:unnamed protein product [Bursaphelenchus xylophilus]CAG9100124.1 unnamed protein product [Bursaphelenchus xylophilus]